MERLDTRYKESEEYRGAKNAPLFESQALRTLVGNQEKKTLKQRLLHSVIWNCFEEIIHFYIYPISVHSKELRIDPHRIGLSFARGFSYFTHI